ncbi:ABC transporter permease subunit [Methanoregula sp.]|uniref:ABC transporter permease n=1 Tax=Methanoregula sp. TaxID=2052170 RepID=UPI0026360A0D|nr:ABC transporter permease subunit [Methanoregula sp.]MDD5143772.1 ABC transporter permease subunit [Methanoregula sp.]
MAEPGVIIIAKKEFVDHVRSRKFLLLLGILLVVACVGILNGIADYHAEVKDYDSFRSIISASPPGESKLPEYLTLKPSVLLVFNKMGTLFVMIGGILGIAMGFDLVTREKESKSLKLLLAHPAYRDEVINGKALGGISAIAIALAAVMVLSLALLLISGLVPDGLELMYILIFSAVTFLYIFTCFAISLMMSTACEESGRALIFSLVIFIVLGFLIPTVLSTPFIMEKVIGPAPEMPQALSDQVLTSLQKSGTGSQKNDLTEEQSREAWSRFKEQTRAYGDRQMSMRDFQYFFSPVKNYEKIVTCLTDPTMIRYVVYFTHVETQVQTIDSKGDALTVDTFYMPDLDFDFSGILSMITGNIIALCILPSVFFGLAYVRFMRMDIR